MSALSDACRVPFANGTEGEAWMSKWCSYCAHDHGMHGGDTDPMCSTIGLAMLRVWPGEAWLPEPDDGEYHLPSRLVCMQFKPCDDCGGDPGADDRAERIQTVVDYWRTR